MRGIIREINIKIKELKEGKNLYQTRKIICLCRKKKGEFIIIINILFNSCTKYIIQFKSITFKHR